jgi:hypothetical protein
MQLMVTVNDTQLCALLDSGSTHNFIDMAAATLAGVLHHSTGLRVALANGDHVISPGCARAFDVSIGDERFILDCYGLELGLHEMVLRVQWLESLGPILWDFGSRTMMFARQG